jgi:hypothetical protein
MADQLEPLVKWYLTEIERQAKKEPDPDKKDRLMRAHVQIERQMDEARATDDLERKFSLKAEECRVIAENCEDAKARASFEHLARSYQHMADRVSDE